MSEYVYNELQSVDLNNPLLFNNSIPCPRGNVFHNSGDGIFSLKGNTNNCFARYRVTYNGNVSTPDGGVAGTPIAVAIAVNGEPRPTSRAIFTPQAVDEYGNVTSTAIITVPRGCCFSLSVRAVSGITDGTTTPAPTINVINSNLVIDRIA